MLRRRWLLDEIVAHQSTFATRANPFKYPDLPKIRMDAAQCKKVLKDSKVSYKWRHWLIS